MNILDLPDELTDSICDHISQFSVAILKIFTDSKVEQFKLIGSGTLVIVNSCHAILTAEHVLAQLRGSDQLGLLSSFTGHPHRHKFNQNHIVLHRIAKGDGDSEGPDLGLIVLPESNIGRLRAEKTFFNIDKRQERFSKGFIKSNRGFWFTCGFPGEFEVDMKPIRGFAAMKGYHGLCGISGIRKEYDESGFDYLEMSIEYDSFNTELPKSFGGVSGSGVWQVPLIKNSEANIEAEEYILSGVVFYQTRLEGNHRLLRCHGRRTIYVKVPEYLNSILSS
jgi:hypothetical protein